MKTTKNQKLIIKKLTLLVKRSAILDCFSYVYDPDLTYNALKKGKFLRGDILITSLKDLTAREVFKHVQKAEKKYLAFAHEYEHVLSEGSKCMN